MTAVVYKNTKYCKGLVVVVAHDDNGILFGKIVLILLHHSRVYLILEKCESVLLIDVGVYWLTVQGEYMLLPRLDGERLQHLVETLLIVVGIEDVEDLRYIKEDDEEDILTPCQCRKLLDAFQRRDSTTQPHPSSAKLPTSTPPASPAPSFPPSAVFSSQWVRDFQIPWEKIEQRAAHSDRLQMIRVIVDAVRLHCMNPTRAQCAEIAKAVVAQYPKSFGDVTDEGDVLGCGYTSLLNQIKTRVEHHPPQRNTFNQLDSYGCVHWQPQDLPEGETPDSLEVKRQMPITLYTNEGPRRVDMSRVDELKKMTYWKQRELINSSPPPQVSTIGEEWPFLFEKRWLCSRFENLTGIDVLSRLTEAFLSKGRRVINFFLQQRLKWKGSIQSLLTEMENNPRTLEDTDLMATSAILLLMAFFKEPTESLFILADVSIGQESIPNTPRLIMLGRSLMASGRWMVSIEGKVAINLGDGGFVAAFTALFAAYYVLNIEYQEDAACTLEVVQRFLVRINPEEGKKCTARQGVSKKTGRVVQKKATPINPHVNNFIRLLLDFEWKTLN
uniref:Uncharacterized protein n=1 Tax=Sander lucioperca TaxID=283035 RepID=A0A8C9X4V2_SANLU